MIRDLADLPTVGLDLEALAVLGRRLDPEALGVVSRVLEPGTSSPGPAPTPALEDANHHDPE